MRTYEDELLEEYYRGQTNGFNAGYANALTKATEWLEKNVNKYTYTNWVGTPFVHEVMLEKFKEAMKQ